MTILLKIRGNSADSKKIKIAAKIIKNGGIVIFPTETVYGIGANAYDLDATSRIFDIKKRPRSNQLIVHISNMKMFDELAIVPKKYHDVIKKIWPGPLTLRVKARKKLPRSVTAGLNTLSIRMPESKIARQLIDESGVPIAAPSANLSKMPSSTRGSHAMKYFNGKVEAIIDAGPSKFGLESTILELDTFTLARPGAFTKEMLEDAFGRKVKLTKISRGLIEAKKATVPGIKFKHYSPKTPLLLFEGNIDALQRMTSEEKKRFVFIGSKESCKVMKRAARSTISIGSQKDLWEIASNLFDSLIRLDDMKVKYAIIESYEEKGIGLAIMNRLRKASVRKTFKTKKELDKLLKGV